MNRVTIITTALAAALTLSIPASAGWEKHGHKDGVTVYTTDVEGSDVPMVRAVASIDASTDDVWSHLITMKSGHGLKVKKKLGACSDTCDLYYMRLGHPFIKDRHFVVKMKWSITEKDGLRTYKRTWNKTSDENLPESNAMTVEMVKGSWTLKPASEGTRTRLSYVSHLDLGGNVPPGLFSTGFIKKSYAIVSSIRETF